MQEGAAERASNSDYVTFRPETDVPFRRPIQGSILKRVALVPPKG